MSLIASPLAARRGPSPPVCASAAVGKTSDTSRIAVTTGLQGTAAGILRPAPETSYIVRFH